MATVGQIKAAVLPFRGSTKFDEPLKEMDTLLAGYRSDGDTLSESDQDEVRRILLRIKQIRSSDAQIQGVQDIVKAAGGTPTPPPDLTISPTSATNDSVDQGDTDAEVNPRFAEVAAIFDEIEAEALKVGQAGAEYIKTEHDRIQGNLNLMMSGQLADAEDQITPFKTQISGLVDMVALEKRKSAVAAGFAKLGSEITELNDTGVTRSADNLSSLLQQILNENYNEAAVKRAEDEFSALTTSVADAKKAARKAKLKGAYEAHRKDVERVQSTEKPGEAVRQQTAVTSDADIIETALAGDDLAAMLSAMAVATGLAAKIDAFDEALLAVRKAELGTAYEKHRKDVERVLGIQNVPEGNAKKLQDAISSIKSSVLDDAGHTHANEVEKIINRCGKLEQAIVALDEAVLVGRKEALQTALDPVSARVALVREAQNVPSGATQEQIAVTSDADKIEVALAGNDPAAMLSAMPLAAELAEKIDAFDEALLAARKAELETAYEKHRKEVERVLGIQNVPEGNAKKLQDAISSIKSSVLDDAGHTHANEVEKIINRCGKLERAIVALDEAVLVGRREALQTAFDPVSARVALVREAQNVPSGATQEQTAVTSDADKIETALAGDDPAAMLSAMSVAAELAAKIDAFDEALLAVRREALQTAFEPVSARVGPVREAQDVPTGASRKQTDVTSDADQIEAALEGTDPAAMLSAMALAAGLAAKIDAFDDALLVGRREALQTAFDPVSPRVGPIREVLDVPSGATQKQIEVTSDADQIEVALAGNDPAAMLSAMPLAAELAAKIDAFDEALLAGRRAALQTAFEPVSARVGPVREVQDVPTGASRKQTDVASDADQIEAALEGTDPEAMLSAMALATGLAAKIDAFDDALLVGRREALQTAFDPASAAAVRVRDMANVPPAAIRRQTAVAIDTNAIQAALDGTDPQAMAQHVAVATALSAKVSAFNEALLAGRKAELTKALAPLKAGAERVANATDVPGNATAQQQAVKLDLETIIAAHAGNTLAPVTDAKDLIGGLQAKIDAYYGLAFPDGSGKLDSLRGGIEGGDAVVTALVASGRHEIAFAVADVVQSFAAATEPLDGARELARQKNSAMQEQARNVESAKAASEEKYRVRQEKVAAAISANESNLLSTNQAEYSRIFAEQTEATEEHERAERELQAAQELLNTARTEKNDADTALEQAQKEADRAELAKRTLSRDLRGGPLSQISPGATFDVAAQAILAQYGSHPDLASSALDMATRADNPQVLAQGVEVLGPLEENGFRSNSSSWPKDVAEEMSRNSLEMGAHLGGDYFDRMKTYYDSNRHADENPIFEQGVEDGRVKIDKIGNAYSRELAKGLVDDDGHLALTDGFATTRDTMQFHPKSLQHPTPALVDSVEAFRDIVRDEAKLVEYTDVLDQLNAPPPDNAARTLVAKTTGKTDGPLGPTDCKRAVVSAMITPFDQGQVGSCFATAPARKMKESNPLSVMQDLTDIVSTGKLSKGAGDSEITIPAITKIADGQNDLLRSWEYSITTMGARRTNSREKTHLKDAMFGTYAGQSREHSVQALRNLPPPDQTTPDPQWAENQQKIEQKLAEAFSFKYDSTAPRPGASDRSSSKGAFVLQRRVEQFQTAGPSMGFQEEAITTPEAFQQAMKKELLEALDVTADSPMGQRIVALTDSAGFVNSIGHAYKEGYSPWHLDSGGSSDDSATLLTGETQTTTDLCTPASTATREEKTKTILSNIVDTLVPDGDTDDGLHGISVYGVHEMNAVVDDPGMKALKGASPEETQDNINRQLIEPGARLAGDAMDPARTVYLFDKMMDELIAAAGSPDRDLLVAAKQTKPTDGLTPKGLKDHVKRLRQNASNDAMDGFLLKQLDFPEVTIADTNWGSASDHKYFVVAPDPEDGKLVMWEKSSFSGTYKKVNEADWLGKKWQYLA